LNKIQELAQATIGFDAKRGDTVSVQNMSFDSDASDLGPAAEDWGERSRKALSDYASLIRPVSLLVLFLLAYLFVLRPIQKQALGRNQPEMALQPALGVGPDRLTVGPAELGDGARRATLLKEQAVELIKQKPTNTARAVQAWLREEPS
jgi:flagellar M-ring protein FliF